jgi:hypothetical protein
MVLIGDMTADQMMTIRATLHVAPYNESILQCWSAGVSPA